MGAGGQTSKQLRRVPYSKPPFTLAQVKAAVPPHCFKRSVLLSFYYLIQDFASAFLFYSLATNYIHLLPSPLSYLAWSIYWIFQSSALGGLWVIAHDCNHHAFSDYQWLDDTVGLVLHSALLVPYFSWKYSHRRHHSNTGSIHYDEVFVPKLKYRISWYAKYINNPPGRILKIFLTLTLGWFSYLLFNIASREYDRFACHFDPYSPIFSDRERLQILISDAGVLAVVYGLYSLVSVKGLAWVLCVYGAPIIIVNAGLVLVTWLHHTHPALPHYDSSEWDWLRGALSTVDRDYGIMNRVLHNITNTHVAHHLFSTMPHYHAMEATKAIRPVLGDYYRFDRTPIYEAVWRETKECIYVEADESDRSKGVLWYRNKL